MKLRLNRLILGNEVQTQSKWKLRQIPMFQAPLSAEENLDTTHGLMKMNRYYVDSNGSI